MTEPYTTIRRFLFELVSTIEIILRSNKVIICFAWIIVKLETDEILQFWDKKFQLPKRGEPLALATD